jgi:hypothetical protein
VRSPASRFSDGFHRDRSTRATFTLVRMDSTPHLTAWTRARWERYIFDQITSAASLRTWLHVQDVKSEEAGSRFVRGI